MNPKATCKVKVASTRFCSSREPTGNAPKELVSAALCKTAETLRQNGHQRQTADSRKVRHMRQCMQGIPKSLFKKVLLPTAEPGTTRVDHRCRCVWAHADLCCTLTTKHSDDQRLSAQRAECLPSNSLHLVRHVSRSYPFYRFCEELMRTQ